MAPEGAAPLQRAPHALRRSGQPRPAHAADRDPGQRRDAAGEPAVTDDVTSPGWSTVSRAAHRMNTMIEEMLDYAREGGDPSGATDLGEVVGERPRRPASRGRRRQGRDVELGNAAAVRSTPSSSTPSLNLLSNALKFARPGTPAARCVGRRRRPLRVERHRRRHRGRPGAARGDVRPLRPRRQAGRGQRHRVATAKRVVEAHGGRIGMEAAEARGTTVWFELPA